MPRKCRKRKRRSGESPPESKRPKKYRQWNEESMSGAIKAVIDGKMGVNRAADQYGIPRSTLKDRVSARHGTKSGPQPYLSYEEEQELARYLVKCAEIGYPKTKDEVIGIVRQTLHKKKGAEFAEDFKGRGWWERFIGRWPKLTLRRGDPLAVSRAEALTAANLSEYYDLLKTTMEEHGLMNLPSRIYNMDESGMPLDHKPPKVVALKGMKKVHCRTSGNKGQITIIACANAAGSVLPPMVIFEGKRLNPEWTKGDVPDTLYGMSDRGWTDQELFFYWMTELFLEHIPPARPVMLLVDGHSSHYEPETIKAAAEQGVVIFCLPPHCTHVAQPLDVSFFHPLKVYWSEACHSFMQANPGCVVTKYNFSKLFSMAWYKAIQPQNIISGFSKCGICPYNSNAIKAPIYPTGSLDNEEEKDNEAVTETRVSGENLSLEAGDEAAVNWDNGGDINETANGYPSYSPEQIALFTLRYENGYDIFTDPYYVSWLLENHPDDIPCDVMDGVSDPFQPFEGQISAAAVPDFTTDSFASEYDEDQRIQEISLLSSQETEGIPSLPDVIYQSTLALETPLNTKPQESDSGNVCEFGTGSPTPPDAADLPNSTAVGVTSAENTSCVQLTPLAWSKLPLTSSPFVESIPATPGSSASSNSHSQSTPTTPAVSLTSTKFCAASSPLTPSLLFAPSKTSTPEETTRSAVPVTSAPATLNSSAALSPSLGNSHHSLSVQSMSSVPSTPTTSHVPLMGQTPCTSQPSKRKPLSAISGFLNFPSVPPPKKKTCNASNGPRVLTSATAIALMEEKERKKKEEQEAKERRKREREEKRVQREEEKKRKAKERERKQAERQRMAKEREENKRKKAEAKVRRKAGLNSKENQSTKNNSVVEDGLQEAEISTSECAACFGLYEDDVTDGQLMHEWIQCTDPDCGKWMHIDCLNKEGEMYFCSVCNNTFR